MTKIKMGKKQIMITGINDQLIFTEKVNQFLKDGWMVVPDTFMIQPTGPMGSPMIGNFIMAVVLETDVV